MKKVSVIGHFADGLEYLDGQTVKTKILTAELKKELGEDAVARFDTHGGKITLLKSPFQALSALRRAKNVIILPAHNGVRIYGRLLPFFKHFFRRRRIHYVVIGGWLSEFLKDKKGLARKLKKFDGIYVETQSMKTALEEMGFKNIVILPNCKELDELKQEDLVYPTGEPYKLCTFSRVEQKKGIAEAVRAVKEINEECGRTVYTLDIYGKVDEGQSAWFDDLKASFPPYVTYGGTVPFDKSVSVLKDYFALLFPTHYYTEGIPGTLIDAYAAGVPVITAVWMNSADIFEEGVTGRGFEFDSYEQFKALLAEAAAHPDAFCAMKPTALKAAEKFKPEAALQNLTQRML